MLQQQAYRPLHDVVPMLALAEMAGDKVVLIANHGRGSVAVKTADEGIHIGAYIERGRRRTQQSQLAACFRHEAEQPIGGHRMFAARGQFRLCLQH